MIKLLIIKGIIFILIFSFIYYKIFINIFNVYNIETRRDSSKLEAYYKICNSGKLIIKRKFEKIEKPKISIISPVHNREEYILRFLRSIQNQDFIDIEIIFVDDFSTDNSSNLIEEYQKEDKRIVLLKNKYNKGTLISRNNGVIFSKSEYVILPDPDDILSKDILLKCYETAIQNDYDLIRFNLYLGKNNIFFDSIVNGLESGPIYRPQLSNYLFYGKGKLQQIDFNVSNKFIKRITYIKAILSFNKYYLNLYMINLEDGLVNFLLYRSAKSFYFLKKVGYYYLPNEQSITLNFQKNYDETIRFIFINLIFVFENTKKNKVEKNMVNCLFERMYINILSEYLNLITKDFDYYIYIINQYLNSKFINQENKNKLNKLKSIIIKVMKI